MRSIFILFTLLHFSVQAQEYYFKQYRVEKGLPSDIVKACVQDSLGYFWNATDEGLVKYDGVKFTSYREATHSNFVKGFFTTRSGKLFAFGDLDLIEIKNYGDTVLFKKICPVSRVASDSALSYPKLLYEDLQGNIWVSESQAVVRLHQKSLKRYEFTLEHRSPQFLRSFSFFEDRKHRLHAVSFQGTVFRYNHAADKFEPITLKLPEGVEYVSVRDTMLLIGASNGVFTAGLNADGDFTNPQQYYAVPQVSFMAWLSPNKLLIATRGNRHFITDLSRGEVKQLPHIINNINHVYISRENDIWASSNEGLIMMREDLFQQADDGVADFIESITEDPDAGIIYYATSTTLYAFHRATRKNEVVLHLPTGYFQSLLFTKDGLWVANAFRVFLFSQGRIQHEFDFSKNGRFVTSLNKDNAGNIWLAIPGSPRACMIDAKRQLKYFDVPLGNEGVINAICSGREGVYIVSAGKSSYLFFKSYQDSTFKNVSIPITFSTQSDFNVADAVVAQDKLWLATSEGLLSFDHQKIERIDLGSRFSTLPVKAVGLHPEKKLLAANAYGMLLYDTKTGGNDLFNESSGLLSNTITHHGFFVSKDQTVWVGTAKGIVFSEHPLNKLTKTPRPQFILTLSNGKKVSIDHQDIPHGSFLSFEVSSITFPENEVTFQYRLLPNETWMTTHDPELKFSDLDAGNYSLEVRAKKNGPYSWSDSSHLSFTITKPFWQRVWFYMLCFAALFTVMTLVIVGIKAREKARRLELQRLIDERTNELRVSNEELINLNLEKNNLIGIVAHDLKSPLSQILSLLSLIKLTGKIDADSQKYLGFMETSTSRLMDMIGKILDVDGIESKQLNLKMERVSLDQVFNAVTDRFIDEAIKKKINIARNIDKSAIAKVDKNYVEQVLENLVSNAIKFSPLDKNVFVNLHVEADRVICEIKDEGPGLTEDDKKKLFSKYQKLSARPTGNESSTGLGLSIVKKFVGAMDGEIWCESEEGKGASFYVSFTKG
ncbi:sensor histidine kinase [Pseudochryseolinea flava]|uniref:histidine kinase n=1 Tax=Pseudochryseolinea flava TaxID=2059302 RepID=A0A364XZF9_9BACT|nr:ATP-binding protein [Pseudochryseolinea flava]RAV99002.1 hypothetical protein DQQ10_20610 [Pseudochryseolinea flava]